MAATLLFSSILIGLGAMFMALIRSTWEALIFGVLALYAALASLAFSRPELSVQILVAMLLTGALFIAIIGNEVGVRKSRGRKKR